MASVFDHAAPGLGANSTPDEPRLLAIEIGGTKLQLCVGLGNGSILARERFTVARERGAEGIRAQIAGALPALLARWRPGAVGAGYGGPVNWQSGRIWKSYHIAGWSDFPLGDWLREQTGLPAFVENDSNLAALAEARCGAGRGANPVFYTNMGSGVGGGLVIKGALYHGARCGELEFGHLRLGDGTRILEDNCAGWSLDRAVREAVKNAPDSTLAKRLADDPENPARSLGAALAVGDPLAEMLLENYAGHLAQGLGVVTQLLHPEIIVLGGGVSLLGEALRGAVAARLPDFIMDLFRPGPEIRLAVLREDAVPVGALLLAAERLGEPLFATEPRTR